MATATKERKKAGIHLDAAALKHAVAAVNTAVQNRTPKPVLLNVLLANGGLVGTDLELQINAALPYTDEPLLLPFARLKAILAAASGDDVTIQPKGSSAVVRIGSGEWTLPTEDAAEFPRWEPDGARPVARIPADQFCRAVRSVVYATDNESSRYALGAVLVEMKAGTVTFVGTDGRRLSAFEVEVDQATDDGTTLIPARAIEAMAAVASHSQGAVQIEATGKEVIADIDGTTVTALLVDGRFPRWRDVFPDRQDAKAAVVSAPDLLAATRQAAIVTSEQSKGVVFAFTSEGIHLTARSSEAGESSVTCPVLEAGPAVSVKLDPAFVIDFLRSVDAGEPVEVEAVDHQSAVVLRSGDCRGVIMPLAKD
jgi:DNA polymerase-3 subunit beta